MRKSMLKQEFQEFRVSEDEGLHKGYDRFQKILSQLNQLQAKPDNEDCNIKFLRALPSSWSQVAITLKAKGGLDYLNFNDLYNKLKSHEIDIKGGSSYKSNYSVAALSHSAFVSTTSGNNKMSMGCETSKQYLNFISESQCTWQAIGNTNARFMRIETADENASQVYGMIAGRDDDDEVAGEFALMGVTSQVQTYPFGCHDKYVELKKEFDDLEVQYKEYYIQVQALYNTLKLLEQQRPWYQNVDGNSNPVRFVKEGAMNAVPPPITGTFMPTSIHSDFDESQMTYGKNSKWDQI
ncbi:hypothetical protein Tco_1107481 [Tanacetum coccineum]